MPRKAIVIGAGIGGLGTAIRLQHRGWQVTVLEKNPRPGGRCGVFRHDGFTFDTGPTLLLMRDVVDDLFTSVGRNLEDYVELIRTFPNYRVQFGDGDGVEFSSDFERMRTDLDRVEVGAGEAFMRYLSDAEYKYRVARDRFVERNFCHWYEFFTPSNLLYVHRTNTLRKLDRHAQKYFRDPRLVAAFTFQTMYLGLAPHHAPAVYSLLPFTELKEGIWFPRGGMYCLVQALHNLARELGVEVKTNSYVCELKVTGTDVTKVVVKDGDPYDCDIVVSNADLPYTYDQLVPEGGKGPFTRRKLRQLNYGSSAYLMYLGVARQYAHLHHHNVFLSKNIRQNFDEIFRDQVLPEDPSLYVNVSNRTDSSLAPPGHDAIYVLVPVPRLSSNVDWNSAEPNFRTLIYDRLEAIGLEDLRRQVVVERVYTPQDFVSDYNLMNGSAFGLSHNFFQVGYMRPANKARNLRNLYFVGASTVPGGGIPMVIIGSRLVAERIEHDHARA